MQLIDGRPVYAATDLVAYLACEHLTGLERAALAGLAERPVRNDPELDIIRKRGFEHEQRYLAELRGVGRNVRTIALDGSIEDRGEQLRAAAAETVAAMADGPDVIYQATFFDGTWRGHADFLLRVDSPERPSRWGAYHYEVADTKLARHVKASAVLQICSYIDQLERLQGIRPEWMHVVLGGSSRTVERLRVDDYLAYYRAARDRFLNLNRSGDAVYPPAGTYPDPVEHCDVCRWSVECAARRRRDDHLSLVAGISGRQRRALMDRGVSTLAALGRLPLPVEPPLDGTSEQALVRVREQARIQLEGREEDRLKYELLLPEPGQILDPERGLATLPPPSPNDLFVDLEGDPYALEDGLDYLFGVLESDGEFHAFWSRDDDGTFTHAGEQRAFEQLIDFIVERLDRDPSLHVYHYAPYEPTAFKRLMGRYATREAEVDRLLRGGVLVDLLRAVRQSLRASVESYSIKRLEPLYGFVREIDLRDAGSSIVAFEEWLELGEGERPAADHLDRIERYNRDDVVSNERLRDWLESLRDELERRSGQVVPRPTPREAELPADVTAKQEHVEAVAAALASDVPADAIDRTPVQHARWLLAQLLGWHRREDKSTWWEFHRLMDLTADQLVEESDPIGGLEPVGPIDEIDPKGRQTWRYRFPPQDYDLGRGDVHNPAKKMANPQGKPWEWGAGDRVVVDDAAQTIQIRRFVEDTHPESLVPLNWVRTPDHQDALLELGDWVLGHGIDAIGPNRAARDLLLGLPPRVGQRTGEAVVRDGERDLEAARRLALALDHTTLAVQGPPGSGKTYTGARMICSLLAAGRKVGITATSHKVIGNLLEAVLRAVEEESTGDVRPVQKGEKDQVLADPRVVRTTDNGAVRAMLEDGRANLAAGTSWLWASRKMGDAVDVLFVDEAGQISLANVVAMSRSAMNLVLLGDPQQLDQPLQGSHPPGADRSALAHVLGNDATMPPSRGLFLERTWRLHPELCRFTSEVFYEDRLESEPHLVVQRVHAEPPFTGVGPRLVAVATEGYDNESPDEAEAVAELATLLVDGESTWVDAKGTSRPVRWEDILIVAPYNAQVGAIRRLLPDAARVGTVDKFQGQEAPISIYSMTTSSPEQAPRGMDFLYSRNRLNVATSRARCLAIVAASPALLRVRARTPAQMRLANALCRFVEMAGEQAELPVGQGRLLDLGLV